MKVVLDTNIIYRSGGRRLIGIEVDIINKSSQKLNIEIFVPDVVIEELHCIYSEDYQKLSKQVYKLSRFLLEKSARPEIAPVEKTLADYIISIEKRLSELGIRKVSHDKIGHSWILERIFNRRRPFPESGKRRPDSSRGYRDSLIWEVICRKIASKNEKTVFITDNWQDFAERKTNNCRLHQHLVDDLKSLGLPEESVVLCSSLEEFNRTYIKPELTLLEDIERDIEKESFPYFKLSSFISKHLEEISEMVSDKICDEENKISESVGEDVSGVYLDVMYEPHNSWVVEVRKLSDSEILVSVEMEAEAEVEFFLLV